MMVCESDSKDNTHMALQVKNVYARFYKLTFWLQTLCDTETKPPGDMAFA
jgi:hypothetical protein